MKVGAFKTVASKLMRCCPGTCSGMLAQRRTSRLKLNHQTTNLLPKLNHQTTNLLPLAGARVGKVGSQLTASVDVHPARLAAEALVPHLQDTTPHHTTQHSKRRNAHESGEPRRVHCCRLNGMLYPKSRAHCAIQAPAAPVVGKPCLAQGQTAVEATTQLKDRRSLHSPLSLLNPNQTILLFHPHCR